MTCEVRQDGAYWTLYVDGVATIRRESFAVCDRVRSILENPDDSDHSEAMDVARAIAMRLTKTG